MRNPDLDFQNLNPDFPIDFPNFSEVKSVFGFPVRLGNPDLDFENLNPDFPIERTHILHLLQLGPTTALSPLVRESRFREFLLVESRKGHLHDGVILLLRPERLFVESGILGYGIRNTVKGMLNATEDWNPESSVESGIHSVESRLHDCLGFPLNTWGETCICNCIQTCTCTPAVDETSDENEVR